MSITFDTSYTDLPARFYAPQAPAPVPAPRLIALNESLARDLGLDADWLRGPDGLAMLAGNRWPQGAAGVAQAYAGHQFGGWVPQLGDGRAVLLGEVVGPAGRRDIVLKGAGRTVFSRGGDGRAWIGPVLREYIMSEAMHALEIPTTRALAAVATGAPVLRETSRPGAILARVAASHIRVGTFQYFAARNDIDALSALSDHVIARHFPQADSPLALLNAVVNAQADLVARWMSVGFIHGVMNTDNMSVAGETIDYGPCAMMDSYHPDTVYSSIDRGGRYAYANQPKIAAWNLAQFASCLVPLMGPQDAAIAEGTAAVNGFAPAYQAAYLARFRAKLGLADQDDGDGDLIAGLLDRMAANGADFTNTFNALAHGNARDQFIDPTAFDDWAVRWKTRRRPGWEDIAASANPAVIPRNHRIEQVIGAALAGDEAPFHDLLRVVSSPFDLAESDRAYSAPPRDEERVLQTFCGT